MKRIVAIIIIGIIARLPLLVFGAGADINRCISIEPDSARYIQLADNMLDGYGFAKQFEDGIVHTSIEHIRRANGTWTERKDGWHPEVFRTPAYPVFISLLTGSRGIAIILLIQCIMGSVAAAMLSNIAFVLFGNRSAWLTGLMWALHPAVIIFDCIPLTESLFCFLGLLAMYMAITIRNAKQNTLCGMVMGLCAITRPLGILYLPFIILAQYRYSRINVKYIMATILISIIPPVLWSVRNHYTGNGFRLSTVGDVNLYYYALNYLRSERNKSDWYEMWPATVRQLSVELKREVCFGDDVFKMARTMAIHEMINDPINTLRVALKSHIKLMIDHSLHNWYMIYGSKYVPSGVMSSILEGKLPANLSMVSIISMLWVFVNISVVVLSIIGVFRLILYRKWHLIFLLLLPLIMFMAASFPVGLERFRLPIMPLLFLLSSAGICTKYELCSYEMQRRRL